ncbi:MAG: SDR family oxidoreductase [Gammaproteobacteria bacterium]|nr:SDR family oxidoreductase [Gammaproteobacteria bacterium]MBU1444053.1 SDR family oxidoreductase [Gammaproteobacteria bacterium]MBU2407144.1 SDR family oxidoreductase [Gammaproteobacteria bacterium]
MSHAGRNFVVTAAAGGIGGELTMLLLEGGASVLACDISGKRLALLEERAGPMRDRLAVLKVDVADETGAGRAADTAIERFGTVHGVANIAGGIAGIGEDIIDRPIERISPDEYRQTVRLNLDSAFFMTRALVPHFRSQRYGKVVNVASLAAFGNFDHMGNAGYDAAKAGVVGLTHTLSRSLGPDGIRINVVAPGSVYTDKVRQAFSPEFIELQRSRIPLREHVGPLDVAKALAFFLSTESDAVSGEVLRASGGLR